MDWLNNRQHLYTKNDAKLPKKKLRYNNCSRIDTVFHQFDMPIEERISEKISFGLLSKSRVGKEISFNIVVLE